MHGGALCKDAKRIFDFANLSVAKSRAERLRDTRSVRIRRMDSSRIDVRDPLYNRRRKIGAESLHQFALRA